MSLLIVTLQRPSDNYISPGNVIGLVMNKRNDEQHTGCQYFNVSFIQFLKFTVQTKKKKISETSKL